IIVSELSISKGGSSKGTTKVPIEYEHVAATPKFKRRKVSVVRKGDCIKLRIK
ncbi:hypothetical protein J1N35_041278, partial [Gossypium stocksii]